MSSSLALSELQQMQIKWETQKHYSLTTRIGKREYLVVFQNHLSNLKVLNVRPLHPWQQDLSGWCWLISDAWHLAWAAGCRSRWTPALGIMSTMTCWRRASKTIRQELHFETFQANFSFMKTFTIRPGELEWAEKLVYHMQTFLKALLMHTGGQPKPLLWSHDVQKKGETVHPDSPEVDHILCPDKATKVRCIPSDQTSLQTTKEKLLPSSSEISVGSFLERWRWA